MYQPSFLTHFNSVQLTIGVLLLMAGFYGLGHLIKTNFLARGKLSPNSTMGAVEGSLLGLLALILSFTFSISSNRYDKRMAVIVEEANDISTAILRADLYPDSLRKALREELKRYVEHRIDFFEAGRDLTKINIIVDSTNVTQSRLWKLVTDGSKDRPRSGLITLADMNYFITSLRSMFNTP